MADQYIFDNRRVVFIQRVFPLKMMSGDNREYYRAIKERTVRILLEDGEALDESGDLARIFGKAGVGLEPVTIGAIAVVAVAVIAIVGVLVYQHYEHAHIRSENMAQFKAWCEEAKKKAEGGDSSAQEAFKECVKNVKPPEPARDPIETALYVLGGVLGLYVIGYYVVPKLIAYRGAR